MARTRDFDLDTAVDSALQEFWKKGYEGTSLTDLTAAMGINRPSLYAAFGNKEGLFRRVLERYLSNTGQQLQSALSAATAREAVEGVLSFYADAAGVPGQPRGCLLVQGALVCSEENKPIQRELAEQRNAGEAALRERLKRAKAEGDLPADESPADLARYVFSVCHGLAVQAAGGATRAELRRVVTRALLAWPHAHAS